MVHSDQVSQLSSYDWQSLLRANNLVGSMIRRSNCHDNAVAESFFQLLKRERIKRKIYPTRGVARQDVLITSKYVTTISVATAMQVTCLL